MKRLTLFLAILTAGLHSYAQLTPFAEGVKKNALPNIYLPENVSVQFISPEPIQYVDISAKSVIPFYKPFFSLENGHRILEMARMFFLSMHIQNTFIWLKYVFFLL